MNKAKGKDHTKVCWSCGREIMQPYRDWYSCSNCGATYNDLSKFGKGGAGVALWESKSQWLY